MEIINYCRIFLIICSLTAYSKNLTAQAEKCPASGPIVDSIGKPFVTEAYFLREVGLQEDSKEIGLPYDRLSQYPFFILYKDSSDLFNNYNYGFFVSINSFSTVKDVFSKRKIPYKTGNELNDMLSLLKRLYTKRQPVKFEKAGNYSKITKLDFKYEVYKLKIRTVYIGRYCRKVPHKLVKKKEPVFEDKAMDIYVILDID